MIMGLAASIRASLVACVMLATTAQADEVASNESTARAEPGLATSADIDDPKIERTLFPPGKGGSASGKPHPAPLLKLGYRMLTAKDLDGKGFPFHTIQLDLYPWSQRWFRLGFELEVGLSQSPYGATYIASGIELGFQYPWRLTPFLDGRFLAGIAGGEYQGHMLISYTWMGGIEGGVELYLVGRLFLSFAIGWVHIVYRGIDIEYAKNNPLNEPIGKDFASDSFTFKVGFGL